MDNQATNAITVCLCCSISHYFFLLMLLTCLRQNLAFCLSVIFSHFSAVISLSIIILRALLATFLLLAIPLDLPVHGRGFLVFAVPAYSSPMSSISDAPLLNSRHFPSFVGFSDRIAIAASFSPLSEAQTVIGSRFLSATIDPCDLLRSYATL